MKQKKILDALNKALKKAKEKPRICNVKDCNKAAINSHILQKNGILNGIAENGHIWISKTDFLNPDIFPFKKSGINQTYTFKGFCAEHDKTIFLPIEDFEIDYEDYKSQLLFAYRTLLNERNKKEVLIDWHKYIKNSESLSSSIDIKKINRQDEQQHLAINDLIYYQEKLEFDLKNNTENFVFKYRYTEPCQICLASHFTFETTRKRKLQIESTGNDFELLTNIFISFFPIKDENVLIMGYLKEHENKCNEFVQSFFDCDNSILLKKISDLILCRCEMWACSESFYKQRIEPREQIIINIMQESAISIDEDRILNFNIFE